MVFSDTKFWRQYRQAQLTELADRVCVLALFIAFAGAIFSHQPPIIVASLLIVFAYVFVFAWFSSVQASYAAGIQLLNRHEWAGHAITHRYPAPILKSVVLPAETPPPRRP
jgi:hypothetical protein